MSNELSAGFSIRQLADWKIHKTPHYCEVLYWDARPTCARWTRITDDAWLSYAWLPFVSLPYIFVYKLVWKASTLISQSPQCVTVTTKTFLMMF